MFSLDELKYDGNHRWAVLNCSCNPLDEDDLLLQRTIVSVRDAYGESDIIAMSAPDPLVGRTFDLNAVLKAVRMGLPNPEEESAKPKPLTNYRSETAEIVARNVLSSAYQIDFPASPQRVKFNQNQPILGFDGWGLVNHAAAGYAFVLVQVKGTEDIRRPPDEAHKLAEECKRIPRQVNVIARALAALTALLRDTPFQSIIVGMLESIGLNNTLPMMIVAPVIVRGNHASHIDDLQPIRAACNEIAPAAGWGITVSLGMELSEFGRQVMLRARAAEWTQ